MYVQLRCFTRIFEYIPPNPLATFLVGYGMKRYRCILMKIQAYSRKDETERQNTDLCPVICHIMEYGNTSVYQWRTGNIPTVIGLINIYTVLFS